MIGLLADSTSIGQFLGVLFFWLALVVLIFGSFWKVFAKAGEPGWASLVPIYNTFVLVKISEKPIWFFVLFFIPVANLVAAIVVSIGVAERFNKGAGFGLGLAFLPVIFYPILAFTD